MVEGGREGQGKGEGRERLNELLSGRKYSKMH